VLKFFSFSIALLIILTCNKNSTERTKMRYMEAIREVAKRNNISRDKAKAIVDTFFDLVFEEYKNAEIGDRLVNIPYLGSFYARKKSGKVKHVADKSKVISYDYKTIGFRASKLVRR
jgi:nucleoid DNA-binding protein